MPLRILLFFTFFGLFGVVLVAPVSTKNNSGPQYICNTCHDELYWKEKSLVTELPYSQHSSVLPINYQNISTCPDLQAVTTGSRHRCYQQCTYAIRAPNTIDPIKGIPKQEALGCGDLYTEFNGQKFEREPCSLRDFGDGKSEMMCRCTVVNCNRKIAQWANRLTVEWKELNEAIRGDLLPYLYARQDTLWEVPIPKAIPPSPSVSSPSSPSSLPFTSTSIPSTLITHEDRFVTPDPDFVSEGMDLESEEGAGAKLRKNKHLLMAVICGLLALLLILIVVVACCKFRHATANYELKDKLVDKKKKKKEKNHKKSKTNRRNGSTYKMNELLFIDADIPPEPSASTLHQSLQPALAQDLTQDLTQGLTQDERDRRWKIMKDEPQINGIHYPSEHDAEAGSLREALSSGRPSPPKRSPNDQAKAIISAVQPPYDEDGKARKKFGDEESEDGEDGEDGEEHEKSLGNVPNSYAIPEPDGEEEMGKLISEPHALTNSQITEENLEHYCDGNSSIHTFNV